MESTVESLNEELNKRQTELANISQERDQAQADRDTVQTDRRRYRQEQNTALADMEDANIRIDDFEAQVTSLEATIRSLNDRLMQRSSRRRTHNEAFGGESSEEPSNSRQSARRLDQGREDDELSNDDPNADMLDKPDAGRDYPGTNATPTTPATSAISNATPPATRLALTASTNGTFTMPVAAAKSVQCTSDIIPDTVLEKLRGQIRRWNAKIPD